MACTAAQLGQMRPPRSWVKPRRCLTASCPPSPRARRLFVLDLSQLPAGRGLDGQPLLLVHSLRAQERCHVVMCRDRQLGTSGARSATEDSLSCESDCSGSGAATPDVSSFQPAGSPGSARTSHIPSAASSADGVSPFKAGLPPLAAACSLRHPHNAASDCPLLLASLNQGLLAPQVKCAWLDQSSILRLSLAGT